MDFKVLQGLYDICKEEKDLFEVLYDRITFANKDQFLASLKGQIPFPPKGVSASDISKLKYKFELLLSNCINLRVNHKMANTIRLEEYNNSMAIAMAVFNSYNISKYNVAISLAEHGIKQAIRWEITPAIILLSKILTSYYGSSYKNIYKFKKYSDIYKTYLGIQALEAKSELYFFNLQVKNFETLSAPSEEYIKLSKIYLDELKSVESPSFFYSLNSYRVNVVYLECTKQFEHIIFESNKFIQEHNKKFLTPIRLGNIIVRKMQAFIQLGKYEETIDEFNFIDKIINVNSFTWFVSRIYLIKNYIYWGKYEIANTVINQIYKNKNFDKISESLKEIVNLNHGYLQAINTSLLTNKTNQLIHFRISKFLNEIPNFSKDKRGINVAVLLLHITILLQRKDYSKIIDRVDALKYYAYRHLRRDDSFRSNCMIKMVLQMAKADFNLIRTERYTADLYKQLQEVKLAGSGQNIETEIIPYEMLWDIMKRALR